MTPDADPVLLLHGQPGWASDWTRVRAKIGSRARTIAIDRPGWNGWSLPADLAGNAQAALAALDGHAASRATIVGHSLGGAVAAWLAAEHPERVRALVLVAPAANLASLYRLDHWLAAPVGGDLAGATILAGLGLALTAEPVRRRVANHQALDDRYLRHVARRLLAPSAWRAFVTEQRALVRDLPALEARLARISAPTMIVSGTADRIVPASSARALSHQIRNAELVLIERAGHMLPQQQADRLVQIITAMLASP